MLPSIRTLRLVFGAAAPRARAVLEMSRAELDALPTPASLAGTWHRPETSLLRLAVLDELAGTHGIESFETRRDGWCDYLNAGDTYAPTLVWFRGKYRVTTWGDIAERYGA
jgi:hypothetical protein